MKDLVKENLVYRIIGACMEVHSNLGIGFLEPVYQEALAIELANRNIPFEKEAPLDIFYKGKILSKKYYADFICDKSIILELKAVREIAPEHSAQLFNYLKASKIKKGILINFGSSRLEYKSIIL